MKFPDALRRAYAGTPAGSILKPASVGDVIPLVSNAPVFEDDLRACALQLLDVSDKLVQADSVFDTAPDIEGTPCQFPRVPPGGKHSFCQIVHKQNVAYLRPVAIDRDRA